MRKILNLLSHCVQLLHNKLKKNTNKTISKPVIKVITCGKLEEEKILLDTL